MRARGFSKYPFTLDWTVFMALVVPLMLAGCDDATRSSGPGPVTSPDPYLKELSVSAGELVPAFDSSVFTYTDSISYDSESIRLAPILSATSGATLTINGVPALSGQSSVDIPVAHGANTLTVIVESKSGARKTYTVLVVRGKEPPPPAGQANRRVYINDQAAADSLPAALVRTGVKFVLQRGHAYRLSLATNRRNDSIRLYSYKEGVPRLYQTIAASETG